MMLSNVSFSLLVGLVAVHMDKNVFGFTTPSSFIRTTTIVDSLQHHSTSLLLHTRGHETPRQAEVSGDNDYSVHHPATSSAKKSSSLILPTTLGALSIFITTLPADAAVVNTDPVANALVAYSHYLFLLITMSLLVFERVVVKADMDKDTEKSLAIADGAYGISGLLLVISGYFRATEYGKGWDYYSHEPIFWLKLTALGLLGGLSIFPTITIIKRSIPLFVADKADQYKPLSEKLAKRMKTVLNAEISALLSIPLFATLMARGVGFNDNFPWQVGAAFVVTTLLGSGYFYGKQALTWNEDD